MKALPKKYQHLTGFITELFGHSLPIPLHQPTFNGNEKKYLADCIDSTFVSSVGPFVSQFEKLICKLTGSQHAIATVSGTAALHVALKVAGVERGDEVITQPMSFVATANAISYLDAQPVFVDIDPQTLSLSPTALETFLSENASMSKNGCINNLTGKRISAVVPMHTFGLPARIEELNVICTKWGLSLVEDAAEAIGSSAHGRHLGTFGKLGVFSFNGNKTITSGGGGCIVTDDAKLATRARHLTTCAKVPHTWEFIHDQIGFNYRMPNINAALACAQLETLPMILENKRLTASLYQHKCQELGIPTFRELTGTTSNYWLNAIQMTSGQDRDLFLQHTNEKGIATRPVWRLLNSLPAFQNCFCGPLPQAQCLASLIVNLPSSVRVGGKSS